MQSHKVVISHVSSYIISHMLTGWLSNLKYPVVLKTSEKAFNHRIVPTRTDIAHT